MDVPKGYTEEQVLESIERVVGFLARLFKFGYYEIDDMKQEGRLFALEVLHSYNPDLGCTLETFLFNSLKNRFINLYRDKCYRSEPPCKTCAEFKDDFCLKYTDKCECKRWMNWLRRNKAKRTLSNASSADDELYEKEHEDNILEEIAKREIFKIIDKRLPASFRSDYQRLLANVSIPINRRKKLLNMLKHIIGDYLHDEESQRE